MGCYFSLPPPLPRLREELQTGLATKLLRWFITRRKGGGGGKGKGKGRQEGRDGRKRGRGKGESRREREKEEE